MPDLGATDPADIHAQVRGELGFTRQLEQTRRVDPHPRRGGSYPAWFRLEELQWHANHEPTTASAASISRWQRRILPYRKIGNCDRSQLVGIELLDLATFIIAHPDAGIDEMAVYIYNQGGGLYSTALISKRLKELKVTSKRSSTEAFQALRPDVLFVEQCFWNRPPPLGIFGVPRYKMIDVDEFGITLERCNRKKGWTMSCFRVRKDGHYKIGNKLTVLIGIEPGDPRLAAGVRGSIENPRRWVRCIQNGGTTINVFRDFCHHICTSIETNPIPQTDDHRIFLWDNLNAHHAPYVTQTVLGRTGPCQFSIVPRPPYMPKYGPIEYKICDLQAGHIPVGHLIFHCLASEITYFVFDWSIFWLIWRPWARSI